MVTIIVLKDGTSFKYELAIDYALEFYNNSGYRLKQIVSITQIDTE